MTPYNEEETLLINRQEKKPYNEEATDLINKQAPQLPDEDSTKVITKKPSAVKRWAWRAVAGGFTLALLGLVMSFWPEPDVGPPPAEPVALPPREVTAPPVAPLVSPVEELKETAPADLVAREQQVKYEDRRVETRAPPPKLRKKDPGIAPKRISRKVTGKSAGRGVGNLKLVTTYQGKSVSAPVEVNGTFRGNTPLALKLDAGSHAIRIDYRGTRVNEFVTNVTGGQNFQLDVDLRPASEARGNGPSKYGKRHRH